MNAAAGGQTINSHLIDENNLSKLHSGIRTIARRLPPLNGLRVFEAAARHLSFTRAAEELHVTQAAVSHQIKALEDWLGVKLFRRHNRTLLLSDAGQRYVTPVREALERLAAATERLERHEASGALTVSVLPSFAATWLMPRLGRFRALHPEIDVRLSTSIALVDSNREDVDLAIRYGGGDYPGLHVDHLMAETIFPVCSPELVRGSQPLRRPADLRHHTLLHDCMREDWTMWLLAAGVEGVDPTRGLFFTDSSLVLLAAMEGQGVALGRSALAVRALGQGRLVRPFEVSLPAQYAYYVVCPEATADRPKIAAFRNWLLDEAADAAPPV